MRQLRSAVRKKVMAGRITWIARSRNGRSPAVAQAPPFHCNSRFYFEKGWGTGSVDLEEVVEGT